MSALSPFGKDGNLIGFDQADSSLLQSALKIAFNDSHDTKSYDLIHYFKSHVTYNDGLWFRYFIDECPPFKKRLIVYIKQDASKNITLNKFITKTLSSSFNNSSVNSKSTRFCFTEDTFIKKHFFDSIFSLIHLLTAPLTHDLTRPFNTQEIIQEIKTKLDLAKTQGELLTLFNERWNDFTILHLAIRSNQLELVKLMLDYHPQKEDLQQHQEALTNILGVAVLSGSLEMIQLIVNYLKEDVSSYLNPINPKIVSPIKLSFFLGNLEIFKSLLDLGAHIDDFERNFLKENACFCYLKVLKYPLDFPKLYSDLSNQLIDQLNQLTYIDNLRKVIKPLETLLNLSFLNSSLLNLKEFAQSLLQDSWLQKINDPKTKEVFIQNIYQICGGVFTWGSLISRHQDHLSQCCIFKRYSNQSSMTFCEQQTTLGKNNFKTVYKLAKKKILDFDEIYKKLAKCIYAHYKRIGHPDAQIFGSPRNHHFNYTAKGKHHVKNDDSFRLKTCLGDGFSPDISYSKWIKPTRLRLATELKENVSQVVTRINNLNITNLYFKAYEFSGKMIIKYFIEHTPPKSFKSLNEILKNIYKKNSFSSEEIYEFIYTLWHASPLKRGSAQLGLNWLRVLQLQNGILTLPIHPSIALPDCQVLVTNQKPTDDWFENCPSSFDLPHLSDYKGSIEEQITLLECDIGKAFLTT